MLSAQELKNVDWGLVDVLDQFYSLAFPASTPFVGPHELNKVEDDIFSEQNLSLIEIEQVVAEHIPTDGCSSPVDQPKPFLCNMNQLFLLALSLIIGENVLSWDLDLDLSSITIRKDLWQNGIVLLLFHLFFYLCVFSITLDSVHHETFISFCFSLYLILHEMSKIIEIYSLLWDVLIVKNAKIFMMFCLSRMRSPFWYIDPISQRNLHILRLNIAFSLITNLNKIPFFLPLWCKMTLNFIENIFQPSKINLHLFIMTLTIMMFLFNLIGTGKNNMVSKPIMIYFTETIIIWPYLWFLWG